MLRLHGGSRPTLQATSPTSGEISKIPFPHPIVKKKKKKQELHKTKNKITRIFQLLSIKVRNNRRKSNESGDLDRIFCIVDKSVGKKWAKAL
ncbi:hypothetical protein Q7560_04995 [Glaesserella parasuis]|uniref:hypothetical protein n=1 Tax=Glaesserella parasuis TaxID=738 RepID=UPI0005566CBD|nr:hypothetical protein [Glaesserella parasuis]ATW45542.1 hypothetical protein A2U21_06170 [Glaesserella parasuis str. Nagasaki]MDG6318397.1 hypothetical protein [Glaesserella parasuis]MDO9646653.1 hypothetical protein [Glaesserella parasuis]MDO9957277.1 hypothetical protein [Glaesserella parasuis]MDP0322881.1 hypothetical protein [Glaesserella parasuis]